MLSLAIKSLSITIALAAASQPALACGVYLDRMEELKQLSQAAIMLAKEQKSVGDFIGFCNYMAHANSDYRKAISNYESWAICFGTNDKGINAEIAQMQNILKYNMSLGC